MSDNSFHLLAPDEPPAFRTYREAGDSEVFLTCDHAGNLIPRRLVALGLPPIELARHIGWDVGAVGVARRLSAKLDATLVTQTYSRLVIDCNRQPHWPTAMPEVSESTRVPGNLDLSEAERAARRREVFAPYHGEIARLLDARAAAGRRSLLIAVHSFTPVYHGIERPWHLGLLYHRCTAVAQIFKDLLAGEESLCLGDNEPYTVTDDTDYGIPIHGERRGLPNLLIEIRHDLIETLDDQEHWADRLAGLLGETLARLDWDSATNWDPGAVPGGEALPIETLTASEAEAQVS